MIFACTNDRCTNPKNKTFGTFDGYEWRPCKPRVNVCSCPYPLVPMWVCDGCGGKVFGHYDEDEKEWKKPLGFREMNLDNWQVHGCTDSCFEEATTTPTASLVPPTTDVCLVHLRQEVEASRDISTQGSAPEGECFDDRTPSDAFAIG